MYTEPPSAAVISAKPQLRSGLAGASEMYVTNATFLKIPSSFLRFLKRFIPTIEVIEL